jgi:hypothetical protein
MSNGRQPVEYGPGGEWFVTTMGRVVLEHTGRAGQIDSAITNTPRAALAESTAGCIRARPPISAFVPRGGDRSRRSLLPEAGQLRGLPGHLH